MTLLDPDGLWTKTQRVFSLIFSFTLLFIIAYLTICVLDRTPPQVVTQMIPSTGRVHPGEEVDIHFFVNRTAVSEQRADSYLFDGASIRWAYPSSSYRVLNNELGDDHFKVRKMIPTAATPGPSRYRVVIYYRRPLNPIHWLWPVVVVPNDVEFLIVK